MPLSNLKPTLLGSIVGVALLSMLAGWGGSRLSSPLWQAALYVGILGIVLVWAIWLCRHLFRRLGALLMQNEQDRQRQREQLAMASQRQLLQEAQQHRMQRLAMLQGQENEGRRISRELHDGVGQMLTAINLKLTELVQDEQSRLPLKDLVEETTTEIRRISQNLMPSVLVDFGLEAALRMLAKNSLKYAGVILELECKLPEGMRYDQAVEVALYRIAQEAVNNVMKHALTREAYILLEQNNSHLIMHIKDNGKGFDPNKEKSQEHQGRGLDNMRERAELLNGTFRITSQPLVGTHIEVTIPLGNE